MSVRGFSRSNPSLLAVGKGNLALFLFALDAGRMDAVLSLRSFAQAELSTLAFGFVHQCSPLLPQSHSCIGLSLPAADFTHAGLLLLAKSILCSEVSMAILDACRTGSSLSSRSLLHLDSSLSLADHESLEPSMPLRSLSCLGLPPPLVDCARCGSSLTTLDSSSVGFISSTRTLSQLEFASTATSASSPESSLLLHTFAQAELSASPSSVHIEFMTLIPDASVLGLLVSSQSFAQPRA